MNQTLAASALALLVQPSLNPSFGADVVLNQATATYSQRLSGVWTINFAIDGDPIRTGWAVQHPDAFGAPETAAFETAQDAVFAGGTKLTFRLTTRFANSGIAHNLGRFRLSITSDHRGEFADGLADEGDVSANWEVLTPTTSQSAGGAILTRLPDNSLLASGTNALEDAYTVIAFTESRPITGIRLETLSHESLPSGGPGRSPNGNFVLVDFSVSADPGRADLRSSIQVSSIDICWPGIPDQMYQVQYSSALLPQEWIDFGPPVPGTGTNCVTDSARSSERRFYRVIPSP